MKILMINKFLFPKGGAETYMLKLGTRLQSRGHEVQYFGMESSKRCVGNRINAYTKNMDFHGGSKLSKITYPVKAIYSREARRKIHLVLKDFKPDVCHLNNFNYELTPSIIPEIRKWRQHGNNCKIVYTAHDSQLVCPNHMLRNPIRHTLCEKCLGGHFFNCIAGKCIHGSMARSIVGACEARVWKVTGVYRYIDKIICPSEFMKTKLNTNPVFAERTVTLHNFIDTPADRYAKKDYVLYFGRYSEEKGIKTLVEAAKALPDIPFVFAGRGDCAELMKGVPNIRDAGFKTDDELTRLIAEARFSVCPSEIYENCSLSIMESLARKTPVIASNIGGNPELVEDGVTGDLFESGNVTDLTDKIRSLWNDRARLKKYTEACENLPFDDIEKYIDKLIEIYCESGAGNAK